MKYLKYSKQLIPKFQLKADGLGHAITYHRCNSYSETMGKPETKSEAEGRKDDGKSSNSTNISNETNLAKCETLFGWLFRTKDREYCLRMRKTNEDSRKI